MYRRVTIAVLSVVLFAGADWTRFRGPHGSGVSDDKGLPVSWSATENIVWKTPLPGFGGSSPITLGEKIFLTCYGAYGVDQDEPGDQKELLHHVLCIDRATGKILWDRKSKARLPETAYDGGRVNLHGYASATPTTDGEAVYAFFGKSGVWKYRLDGELLWKVSVGSGLEKHNWGSAASPVLCKNLVIVNASAESQSIRALDKATGEEVWRAGGIVDSWSTPLLLDLPGGNKELVVSNHSLVLGFEPATGKKLWECTSVKDYVCPSVVGHQGIVYLSGGRRPQTVAVRVGGRGNVSDTHLLWELNKSTKVPTPLYHDGLLYWVCQRGIACCIKADTGEVVYEKRLQISGGGDKVYASVVLADGKLYAVTRTGGTIVMAAGTEFKELARNDLGDNSVFNATPVVTGGQLLLRSDKFLYCIGK